MAGLKEGDTGFWEAKSHVLEKRLVALAKTEYWLRAVSRPRARCDLRPCTL